MVIVKLIGGLGNQLFQYAAGRRLAYVHGAELKWDVTGLNNPNGRTVRHYELGPFEVSQTLASHREIAEYAHTDVSRLAGIVHRIMGKGVKRPKSYVKEAHYHFDSRIIDLPDGVYLDGYWQSERYFGDITEMIRKDASITTPLEGRNAELSQKIVGSQAVSLHVRRGDYVTNPVTNQVHGTCTLDYYARAVTYMAERVSQPVFFIFSDDLEWVREHLILQYPVHYVDHNGALRCYEDLRLMSLCRHHIIANSSFSWWGAWLNPKPDKIVVAPQRWFNNYDVDTRDLCPAGWVRL